MTRVAVFVDYQNMYHGAREAFGWADKPPRAGQVLPRRLGLLVTDLGRTVDGARVLERVFVARGAPSPERNPVGAAACQRQLRVWNEQARVEAIGRPLNYRPIRWDVAGVPATWDVREKGVDVLLAVRMVRGAERDEFDVAVLCSWDADLHPALQAVRDAGKRTEIAGIGRWRSTLAGAAQAARGDGVPRGLGHGARPARRGRQDPGAHVIASVTEQAPAPSKD